MPAKRILAFSSSRVGTGGYLEAAAPVIAAFLGDAPLHIAFVPFAAADLSAEAYTDKVREGLHALQVPDGRDWRIKTVTPDNAKELLFSADVIMVGGGNTFKLLHDLYACDVLSLIREKVKAGTPYIGWSAGSNILGPGIGTTNDMPIMEPKSFKALGLFPFQINPHYYNIKPEGFNGETRDQRLQEFIAVNPELKIVALPEGTALKMENGALLLTGITNGFLFSREGKIELTERDISDLLDR
jgi:dipeptidase E